MRPGSLFLNLSRGFVVDHAALRAHVLSGHIAGAAVDVFPVEPKTPGEEFVSELRGLPNVILTPHVGGSTEEAQQDIGAFVAGKLRDYAATAPPRCRSTCRGSRCRGSPAPGCCTCT
jgi:D-3-phosphoglycerate dehydrogenase